MSERRRVYHPSGGRVMTKQSEKDGSDINLIMKRWIAQGVVTVSGTKPFYGDFESGLGFHESLNRIKAAKEAFDQLPAAVRRHVDNDPGKFLDLVYDTERRKELEELDLVPEQIPAIPEKVPEKVPDKVPEKEPEVPPVPAPTPAE